ncbi:permease prefix domain 1-containing protein [Micromonospora sp. NPDC050980]|uniref:permease prefix domain 1-containing protein n=1 Tax=Micromonospora sp. NPDC050980 TaxID=3155161 RepID=UPI0033F3390D
MSPARSGEGPVEEYLDELFDQLAGTGAAGRRVLAEAESHLQAAVDDGLDRGLAQEDAEGDAIRRFGPPAALARQVPVPTGSAGASLRRLVVGVWAAVGVTMTWYGISGVLTWLLGWPWVRLLIATGRFGGQPNMCERPWVPSTPVADCATQYHDQLYLIPVGADEVRDRLFLIFAVGGVVLLVGLTMVRRASALGTPAWTPRLASALLCVVLCFGPAALVLLSFGVRGVLTSAQDWSLSYLVSGLLAAGVAVTAGRRMRRSPTPANSA